jgi:hypothetical protein
MNYKVVAINETKTKLLKIELVANVEKS